MRTAPILLFLIVLLISCNGQGRYYNPTGIVDKTDEFKELDQWTALETKISVDDYTRIGDSIFCGEISCNTGPMEGVDASTFKVWAGSQYAKDKARVYYPIEIPCIDYTDCGVCFCGKYIVVDANPETFTYLNKDYATDRLNVYYRGVLIDGADGSTFKVIEGPEDFYFATDHQNVYIHNRVFKGADPFTFYYDRYDKRNIHRDFDARLIIGDKNKEWIFAPPYSIEEVKKE